MSRQQALIASSNRSSVGQGRLTCAWAAVSNDCRVKEGRVMEADTEGRVAAVLTLFAGPGPGARAYGS